MFDLIGVVVGVIQKDSYVIINNFKPYVTSLLYTLCMLDLILNVSFGLVAVKENPFVKLIFSLFKYAFVAYIISHYKEVLTIIIGGGIQLGNIALGKGNNTYFTTDLFDVFYKYIENATKIYVGANAIAWTTDLLFVESVPTAVLIYIGAFLAFVLWTLVSFVVQIGKVFLVSALAYALIPFTVFSKTKDIGMKAISALISSGIYMFVVTTLLNLSNNIKERIEEYFPIDLSANAFEALSDAIGNLIISMVYTFIVYIFLKNADIIANTISTGLLSPLNENTRGMTAAISGTKGFTNGQAAKNPIPRIAGLFK